MLFKSICSICLKMCIFISIVIGLAYTLDARDLRGEGTTLLYFTTQSNIWIGSICLLFAVLMIIGLCIGKNLLKNWFYILKFMFTISITLTFLVMAFILTPDMMASGNGYYFLTPGNIFPHYVTPILAIADFILFDTAWINTFKDSFYAVIMPLYYLVFAFVCSFSGVIFSRGEKVPYYFLNYDKLTWFGFTSNGPGVFWWISILTVFIIGMGFGYIALNKFIKKTKFAKISDNNQMQ